MRQCENWIQSYLKFTEGQQSPSMFHTWCAISLVSAAFERNVWLENGYYATYPNLYIVIIAASAKLMKSTSIDIAFDIFREAFPEASVFSQKITVPAMVSLMKESYSKRKISGGYIVADELGFLLGNDVKDASIIHMLTKIYGCPKVFDYGTIIRGREIAHNTFCNMLAGTTPEWMKDSLPPHSIGGGFVGRIIFVYQSETDKPLIARPKLTDEQREIRKQLISDLREFGKRKGEYKLTDEAGAKYDLWYEEINDPDRSDVDLKGYYARKPTTVLKLALILATVKRDEQVIKEEDISDSIDMLGKIEGMLPETMKLLQTSQSGENIYKIMKMVRKNGKISRRQLMQNVSYFLNARELDDVLNTLTAMADGIISICNEKGEVWYEVKNKGK